MKQIRCLVFAFLIAGTALPVGAQFGREPTDDGVGELLRLMEEWQDGMRSMDAGRMGGLYWDNALRILVFPTGGRHVIEGLDPIIGQQEAVFNQVRRSEPDAFRRFSLPDPEIMFLPEHLPVLVYRASDNGSTQTFQFEERRGRIAISRHIETIREIEPIEAGVERNWADENNNGILEPAEQEFVMGQYRAMHEGPHRARGTVDSWFDWNGNGTVDAVEAERAMTILYRDGLRQGYRFFPEFAEFYGDLDRSGFISIPEADLIVAVAFRDEMEVPRPISGPIDDRLDLDLDGWIIPYEIETFVYSLTRSVASIPGLPLTNPTTPVSPEFVVWWADANENGFLDEHELWDVGTVLQQLVVGTEVVTNPIELLYDLNRDYLLTPDERAVAAEEILSPLGAPEREPLLGVLRNPERLIGRRVSTPSGREMDVDPEDGRIAEHEVFQYLDRRFAELAEVWLSGIDGQRADFVRAPEGGVTDDQRIAGGSVVEKPGVDVDSANARTSQVDGGADQGSQDAAADAVTTTTATDGAVIIKTATRPGVVADQVGDELSIAVTLNPIYPVLRKYYDTTPFGSVTLTNTSGSDLADLEVSFSASNYIDQDRTLDEVESLAAGASTTLDLTLLFNSEVLEITEGDRVDATVTVDYTVAGGAAQETATQTMIFYDRNAIRWDDTRKVAAFVTERDEEIRSYARRVIAGSRDERNDAVDASLQDAMVVFIAMVESDLMYFNDPSSSYASASSSGTTIDYMQFPRQTLTDFGGDCDDLSVCYNALLESVGRRTAFITVPGHIMPAVALQMSADEARSAFMDPTDLVFDQSGTVWVPVEITALEDSFYEAWQEGAKTYRQYSGSGLAEIIPTATAWMVYESVASVVDDDIDRPDQDDISSEFADSLAEFVNTQIATRELLLQADLVDRPGDRRLLNRLGVLYAQYGLWEKAQEQFETVSDNEDYIPALLNLGHIAFLDEDFRTASTYYDRVLAIESSHTGALLASARAHHELENYGNVRTNYEQLRSLSPRLAADYSYLDLSSSNDTERAQAADQLKGRVIWEASEEDSEGEE